MQRALGKAFKDWQKEFEQAHESLKKDSRVLAFVRGIEQVADGQAVGKLLGNILSSENTPTGQKIRAIKIAADSFGAADQKSAEHDLAGFQTEDLYAALRSTALHMLLNEEGFFESLVYEVAQKRPELWANLQQNPPDVRVIEVTNAD